MASPPRSEQLRAHEHSASVCGAAAIPRRLGARESRNGRLLYAADVAGRRLNVVTGQQPARPL